MLSVVRPSVVRPSVVAPDRTTYAGVVLLPMGRMKAEEDCPLDQVHHPDGNTEAVVVPTENL